MDVAIDDKKLKLELRLARLEKNEVCREKFLNFVKVMWPEFIVGRHHKIIADKLERVASGELKRLIINMAPRHRTSTGRCFQASSWRRTARLLVGGTRALGVCTMPWALART